MPVTGPPTPSRRRVTHVVIQPSYGNRHARRHWADTLDQEVPFRSDRYAAVLSAAERADLDDVHPDGVARFWGTTDKHDRKVDVLDRGDIVLLTGQKHVLAIGEIGCVLRNPELARRLWTPEPHRCLWSNIYSFLAFEFTDITYEEVWALPGFTEGDNFQGLRLLGPEKAETILTGLDITRDRPWS
jgi:hypothetical protein